jgi:hypothetical protein
MATSAHSAWYSREHTSALHSIAVTKKHLEQLNAYAEVIKAYKDEVPFGATLIALKMQETIRNALEELK